jgi:adenylylsulfate reductase subunit A
MAGTFEAPEVVQEELDILLIGGGMACCGTAYEMMRWAEAVKAETGKELKIKLVDKAAMDRSGAVAQGLSAINTYIGDKQDPGRLRAHGLQRPDGHHPRRPGLRPGPQRR